MTTFTDNFTDAANTNLEAHTTDSGGSWTNVDGTAGNLKINASNQLKIATSTEGLYVTNPSTGSADHYGQCTALSGWVGNGDFAPCIRATDKNNFIGARNSAGNFEVFKRVAGTFTNILSSAGTASSGDVIKLTATGNTIQLIVNGTQKGSNITESFNNTVQTPGVQNHTQGTADPYIDAWTSDSNGGGAAVFDNFAGGGFGSGVAAAGFYIGAD